MKFKHIALLRSRSRETVTAYGTHFAVIDLPTQWRAVAYIQSAKPTDCNPWACHSPLQGATISADYWQNQLAALSDQWSNTTGKRVIKYSDTGMVTQFDMDIPVVGRVGIVCKQGAVSRLSRKIGTCFFGPKEWREFWMGHQILQMGVPTPLPLACLWRRVSFFHIEARLVTEFISDASPLDQAIREIMTSQLRTSTRMDFLQKLGHKTINLLCLLGQQGYAHRDLKASNILVSSVDHEPQPWLIDLDGLQIEKDSYGPKFQRSLIRLAASLAELGSLTHTARLRALKALLARQGVVSNNWKRLWLDMQRGVEQLAGKQKLRRKVKLAGYELE